MKTMSIACRLAAILIISLMSACSSLGMGPQPGDIAPNGDTSCFAAQYWSAPKGPVPVASALIENGTPSGDTPHGHQVPQTQDALRISQFRYIRSCFGSVHIMGVIENRGALTVQVPTLVITLNDSGGRAVTLDVHNLGASLGSGARAPFVSFALVPEVPKDYQIEQISFRMRAAAFTIPELQAEDQVEVIESKGSAEMPPWPYVVQGRLRYLGKDVTPYFEVAVAGYNSSGELVGVGYGYAGDEVQPGETVDLFVSINSNAYVEAIDYYEIRATAP